MNFLQAQLNRISEQVKSLSATQKMLAASLVAVMILSLMFWSKYAGEKEYVSILPQTLTAAESQKIQARLGQQGIAYTVGQGNQVMVAAGLQQNLLSDLAENRILPDDVSEGLAKLTEAKLFMSAEEFKNNQTLYKSKSLERILAGFKGVSSARVVLAEPIAALYGEKPAAGATVFVQLSDRNAPASPRMAEAMFAVIRGANQQMSPSAIELIINDKRQATADEVGTLGGDRAFEQQRIQEEAYREQVLRQLQHIRDVRVSVRCEIDTTTSEAEEKFVDVKNVLQKETETRERTSESNTTSPQSGEPGVVPNTAVSVGGSSGGGTSTTESETETKYLVEPATRKSIKTRKPAGAATLKSVVINVPRSFFVQTWQSSNTTGTTPPPVPSEAVLKEFIAGELERIQDQVSAYCNTNSAVIKASWYSDAYALAASSATPAAVTSGMFAGVVQGYGKEIGLGALAFASLAMVAMLVRGGSSTPAVNAAGLAGLEQLAAAGMNVGGGQNYEDNPEMISASEEVAGMVASANPFLAGVEVDEDAVQTSQMQEQVAKLVKEDPEAAANLIRRWMTH